MRESRRDNTRSHVHSFRPRNPHPPDHSRKAAAQCSPARKRWTGAPFKPDFGLSGACPRLDRPYPLARSPFGLDFNSSLAGSCVMVMLLSCELAIAIPNVPSPAAEKICAIDTLAREPRLRLEVLTGAPFKPDFGLSGACPRLDRPYPLALARSPFGLDFNSSLAASCMMEKAAPRPVFGALPQSLLHRVPMNVMKLLYKLRLIANVEIVVALLPEMVAVSDQTPRLLPSTT